MQLQRKRYSIQRDVFNVYHFDSVKHKRLDYSQVNSLLNTMDTGIMEDTLNTLLQVLEGGSLNSIQDVKDYLNSSIMELRRIQENDGTDGSTTS